VNLSEINAYAGYIPNLPNKFLERICINMAYFFCWEHIVRMGNGTKECRKRTLHIYKTACSPKGPFCFSLLSKDTHGCVLCTIYQKTNVRCASGCHVPKFPSSINEWQFCSVIYIAVSKKRIRSAWREEISFCSPIISHHIALCHILCLCIYL